MTNDAEALRALYAFLPDAKADTLRPLGEGLINRTFRAETPDGAGYVLQKVNTAVFPDPQAVMRNTLLVTERMREKLRREGKDPARRVPEFLPDTEGAYLYYAGERSVWRCSRLIPGARAHTTLSDPRLLYEAGRGYGEFQRLLDGFPAQELAEVLPGFHDTRRRFEQFVRAAEADVAGRAADCEAEIRFLREREDFAGTVVSLLERRVLPLRVTHNDTKLSNVLLDDETGEAVCVIDLDTVMPGTVLYDFGDAIRTGAASAAEDDPDLSRMRFLPDCCDAFREGFLERCGEILTPAERENLPLGARIIVFEQALRFLTDYLAGDVYYQTRYPQHNLVRARTQIRLFVQLPE